MVNIDRIKALAKQKGVKLGHLCALMGEDQNYLNKVKLGLRRMDDNRIAYLAEKLGTTFAYLTDVSDDPNPRPENKTPIFQYKRYEERRIARSLTPNYVEDYIGVPHGYMDSFNELSEGEIYKLAIVLNTTYEYLMGLTDDPRIPITDRTGIKIKVFGEVAAGIPIQQIDNFDPADPDSWEEIDRGTARSGSYFGLRFPPSAYPAIALWTLFTKFQGAFLSLFHTSLIAIPGILPTFSTIVHITGKHLYYFTVATHP